MDFQSIEAMIKLTCDSRRSYGATHFTVVGDFIPFPAFDNVYNYVVQFMKSFRGDCLV